MAFVLGPKAQALIKPFLQRDVRAYLFSPLEAQRQRYAERSTHRHQPVEQPATARRVGECYGPMAYAHCIRCVCKARDIPVWSPNQLRHNAATRLRKHFGLDAAQVILGHAKADITEIYAEIDFLQFQAVPDLVDPQNVGRAAHGASGNVPGTLVILRTAEQTRSV